jgi:ABC-2 type transport system permease protein
MRNAIHNEILKLKFSGVLWLSTIGTLITNLIFVGLTFSLQFLNTEYLPADPTISWETWVAFHYSGILPMLLPMYLVILCALSVNIEDRNGMWKVLLNLPIPLRNVYAAKLLVTTAVYMLSHLLFVLLLILLPYLFRLEFINDAVPYTQIMNFLLSTLISPLGIIGLVFATSFLSRNFVLPLAVGILGFVTASLLGQLNLNTNIFPFSLPLEGMLRVESGQNTLPVLLTSIIYYIIFSLAGMGLANRFLGVH